MCFVVYISMISQYDELDDPKLFTFQLYRILHVVFPNMSLLLASDETEFWCESDNLKLFTFQLFWSLHVVIPRLTLL